MKPRTLSKITFRSYTELPDGCISTGDMCWNHTGSWRYVKPVYGNRTPPCISGCPCGNPVERWMALLAEGKHEEALDLIRMEHPSPAIMGRVCFHPCEGLCNRSNMEGALGINALERHIGDMTKDAAPAPKHDLPRWPQRLKVAVVGSGPAGLGAAYHLTRLGHAVTVFERLPALGGMLRYGIPAYRLPNDVLDHELERIGRMGVTFKTSAAPAVSELFGQGFDKVFLGIGAQRSRKLGVPGDDHPNVRAGLAFLSEVAGGAREVPKSVLVIGGGNTAIDCARVAKRLGADVRILYRRTETEMPAFADEVAAAREEDIAIEFLVAPVSAADANGDVALTCIRMELGEPGEDGRRKPVPVPGSEFTVTAGLVLSAIGEEAEVDALGGIVVKWGSVVTDEAAQTSDPSVLAGGDMTDSPRTVIDALAGGKRAAIAIDCEARGLDFRDVLKRIQLPDSGALSMERYLKVLREGLEAVEPSPEIARFEMMNTVYFDETARGKRPELAPRDRSGSFAEVHDDVTEEQAIAEAMRCLHCGHCISCDNCYIFCPDAVISPLSDGSYLIDYDFCKGCGLCVHECPRAAMALIAERAEV